MILLKKITKCILVLLLCVAAPIVVAQSSKAIQIFTVTEYVSMHLHPGELNADLEGVLWWGSDDKLISFDGYNYTSYRLPDHLNPYKDHSLVPFVYQDKQGTYWAFIANNGLYTFNPISGQFTPFKLPDEVLRQINIRQITARILLEDSKGRIWFSLNGYGLLCIEELSRKAIFYPVKDTAQYSDYMSAKWLNKGLEMANGDLYFTTNHGILLLTREGEIKIFKAQMPRYRNICALHGIQKGKDSTELILSCWGGGIDIFNSITKTFHYYLPERDAYSVMIDVLSLTDTTFFFLKRDNFAEAGFGIFNSNTKTFRFLKDIESPFVTREYNNMIRSGNYIWAININQLYRFYVPALCTGDSLSAQAGAFEPVKQSLDLRLNKLWVNDAERSLPVGRLSLKNEEGNVHFRFSCKDATRLDSVLFAYRLKGFEEQWHYTYDTHIQYNNLSHGNYTLEIKIARSPLATTIETCTLPLSIAAKWWQTLYFKLFLLIAATFILSLIYYLQVRRIREKAKLKAVYEKKIAEVEMKALRAQMNPHFIFNCLNSINRYIVVSDHIAASRYLTKFAKLIRLILDNSASGIISLQKEMEALDLYIQMEAMRFQNKFSYTIMIDDGLVPEMIQIPSMLIQPYVENAIWHGLLHKKNDDCLLQITFRKTDNHLLEIIVADNGVGREMSARLKNKDVAKNRPKGLQITKDRLELIKELYDITATVTITDMDPKEPSDVTTRVLITIPFMANRTSTENI
ncbi:sensor histidine kinase [Taibaiella koreensis]|uniref:sensor histidine kinase n=1 Tax=Taibaiella koreensis TaxID=1268548 RepID=UPI000E59D322|nr:histidine kinase [Taibaiella koreensis]